jgi:starvation-inducible DNA-binding protein
MSCEKKLQNLINDNFMTYFKSQVYHINVTGPDFHQYHNLFNEVYDYLYEWHDRLSEQLRQLDYKVQPKLSKMINDSIIDEADKTEALAMVADLIVDLEKLCMTSQILYDEAGMDKLGGLETLVGDYMVGVSKLKWMLKATVK